MDLVCVCSSDRQETRFVNGVSLERTLHTGSENMWRNFLGRRKSKGGHHCVTCFILSLVTAFFRVRFHTFFPQRLFSMFFKFHFFFSSFVFSLSFHSTCRPLKEWLVPSCKCHVVGGNSQKYKLGVTVGYSHVTV